MAHVTDLPLVRRGHAFYTDMTINGQNAQVLLDTGSSQSMISESAAHRLGLHVSAVGMTNIVGVGGTRDTGTAWSREVRLGDAHGERLTLTTIEDAGLRRGSEGILGMDFLYGFDIDLDVPGNRIRLYKAVTGCSAPRAVLGGALYSVDLVALPGELSPVVTVSINGRQLRALIDTGSPGSLIFRDKAHWAGFAAGPPVGITVMRGFGPRAIKGEIRIGAPVQIGDLTVVNMPFVVAQQPHFGAIDMLLGYDFITRVHLWISHSSGTVIMQYPSSASPVARKD